MAFFFFLNLLDAGQVLCVFQRDQEKLLDSKGRAELHVTGGGHRKVDEMLWGRRMCGNVDRSDDGCRAVVGNGWT